MTQSRQNHDNNRDRLRSKLEQLIYETIGEINDSYTDEILCDMCQDPQYNEEAIDHLIEILELIKEGKI